MARTIPQLIAAVFARERITIAEAKRVKRHIHHNLHLDDALLRSFSSSKGWRHTVLPDGTYEPVEMGEAFADFRTTILRDLRKTSVSELRLRVRQLLALLGYFVELSAAKAGTEQYQHRVRHRAGKTSGGKRGQNAAEFLAVIDDLKETKHLTNADAVRHYLRQTDAWRRATELERTNLVDASLQRLYSAAHALLLPPSAELA